MTDNENKVDRLFRQKIENINSLPVETTWNKTKGWVNFEKKFLDKKLMINFKFVAATAAIGVLFISIALFLYLKPGTESESCFVDMTGKLIKDINLSGGHRCILAKDSKIQYSQGLDKSQADTLFLEGEAYIETAKERKLIIVAKNSVSKCQNCVVNIHAPKLAPMTVITTISGNVIVHCTDNVFPEMKVGASEKYSIYKNGIFASKEPNDDLNYLAWKTGQLSFDNTPLAYAIKSIENYYGVKIEVKSEEIKYCRYTSTFNKTDINKVIDNLNLSFNTKVKKSVDAIILEGGNCK